MNALNTNIVPVKALTSTAKLVGLMLDAGITSTAKIARVLEMSRRMVQIARRELEAHSEGAKQVSYLRNILRTPAKQVSHPANSASYGDLPHGEKACAQPMLYKDNTYYTEHNGTEHKQQAASESISNIRAREDPSLAGSLNSSAGKPDSQGGTEGPQTPTPSPIVVTTESLIERLAPMLVVEDEEDRQGYAEEQIENLLHAYMPETINKALTRLKQRLMDGYEVKSFSRMLEALCGDVERDMAAKRPERPAPWGTIDLGNGRYISQWG